MADAHSRIARFLAAALVLASASPAAEQVIAGRVVDAASGSAVPRARVTATATTGHDAQRALSGEDGRFWIAVRAGTYRVEAARTGYRAARTDVLTVGPGDTARVDLRLDVATRELAAVTASIRPRRLPMSGAFTPAYPTDSLLAAEPTRVEGGRGRVIIRGVMLTPTPCWRLAGGADRVGPLITLNIQARLYYGGCPADAVGASTYKVTLRTLPPGTYTVRVLHTYASDAYRPAVAMDSAGVAVR
jgi:hypothetical protein